MDVDRGRRTGAAQTDRGTSLGVADSSGAVLAGASVKAIHVGTNTERSVATTPQGSYTIPQLPVGSYIVVISATGFQTTTLENIEVTAGATVRVDGAVAVAGLQDAVTVSADSRQIQTDSVKVATAISSKFIQDLPLVVGGAMRSPLDLSLIALKRSGVERDGGPRQHVIARRSEAAGSLGGRACRRRPRPVRAAPGTPLKSRGRSRRSTSFGIPTGQAEFGHAGGGAGASVAIGLEQLAGKCSSSTATKSSTRTTTSTRPPAVEPPSSSMISGGFGGPIVIPGCTTAGTSRFFFFFTRPTATRAPRRQL